MNNPHRRIFFGGWLLALAVSPAFGSYVVEWSATVSSYAYSTVYTANKAFSYDITGDSVPEIFVSDSASMKIYNGVTHSLIWSQPFPGYSTVYQAGIGNTDGDASKELVVAAYIYNYLGYSCRFYVYDCQTHNQEYASPVKSGYPSCASADVDGDNKNEICLLSGTTSRLLEVYGSTDASVGEHRTSEPLPIECQAVPNPAWQSVRLAFDRPARESQVNIADVTGRTVRRLPTEQDAMTAVWDCRDDSGQPVPPGDYIYRCGALTGRVVIGR